MNEWKRRHFLGGGAALAVGALVACSAPGSLIARPIVVSRSQLQTALQERLAPHWRLANWLDLHIDAAQVDLIPEIQQVQLALALTLQESILKSRWPVQARIGFGTRFDAVKRQFVLSQAQLLSLDSAALPATITATAKALVSQAVTQQLEGQTLYALRPSESELLDRHGLMPGRVQIEAQQVIIPLLPRAPA
jgi:hypothetical protein